MQLTEHKPGNHHYIRKVDQTGMLIDDQLYSTSLILGARLLDDSWPVQSLTELNAETIAPLVQHQPEVVLIGAGIRQSFPDIAVQREFLKHGIGLECMTLAAACRTFNVLMSENRRAVAGLIFNLQG
jgi:uncharacterized protein